MKVPKNSMNQILSLLDKTFKKNKRFSLSEAKSIIEDIMGEQVNELFVKEYLSNKGCIIEEKKIINHKQDATTKKEAPSTVEIEEDDFLDDLDLDDVLNSELKPNVDSSTENKKDYKNNDQLIQTYQANYDDITHQRLIRANTNLVKKYAKFYTERYAKHKLDYDDLVGEGMFGLMKALKRYDPTMGFQFSTYATHWIKQAMTRAIADKGLTIRVPVHMFDLALKVKRTEQKFIDEITNELDIAGLCKELDISEEKYLQVKLVEHQFLNLSSLNTIISEGSEETQLLDMIGTDREHVIGYYENEYNDPAIMAERNDIKAYVHQILDDLTDREANVLRLRYGIDDGRERTLEEVGKVFGVTRERIRQIEAKAFRKLKHRLSRKAKRHDWVS
ncbi:sigma-70 family RNA polymerase sigma factor [Litchfieldia alkalitelluris]|uniref:sigma-70 family RNA polymerase sigma factor n=1 Tax=Litchfieldia alkalitelluris TaxID=304268 RepID=UPI001474E3AC|nr:RNA polymerase sigma factor RpoD/SigA [Litchfieldia alkalitelluris]